MIPFIRSHAELMAITESRDNLMEFTQNNKVRNSSADSKQRKRSKTSLDNNNLVLPDFSKAIRHNWTLRKRNISRFIDELDYNNQIQSSYDLTLLERQNKTNKQEVA